MDQEVYRIFHCNFTLSSKKLNFSKIKIIGISSVQFSHSVVSDSLWPHGLQHTRPACPSPTPGVYSNSCLSCRWCHPAISSSVAPFSRLQSFQTSGSFPMSQFFASGGQSIGVSASTSSNEYSGLIFLRMDWLDLLTVQGTLKSLLQHHSSKASILRCSAFFMVHCHIHTWLLEKPQLWLDGPLLVRECLCFLICCLDWS